MKFPLYILAILPFLLSCSNPFNKIFGSSKTPHEIHADKVKQVIGGKEWIAASENSLLTPQLVLLPYRQLGYFPADKARALTLQFTVKRGEQISIEVNPKENMILYADVFAQEVIGSKHLVALDKDAHMITLNAEETGSFILRLQPPLDSSGQYDLIITRKPSLGFPVAGNKARVGSVWGDARDNGVRSHEGIDIFAPKLTPVIAAADGEISSVKEGGLGGKTVNQKVKGRALSLYYAHLDQQLVTPGQYVQQGDTIGLVGSTGNASTTSPHLHFGIYTYGGAIDPLPFVAKSSAAIPAVANKDILYPLLLTKPIVLKDKSTIKAKTILLPLAVTPSGYLVELENGMLLNVAFNQVKKV